MSGTSNEGKTERSSHAFFFVFLFMTSIVIGTVVVYFTFLPSAAPKQITLAVMPFAGDDMVPEYLKIGYAADLRDAIALSRDVIVVDFESTFEAANLGESFRGFINELGATHFLDAQVSSSAADSYKISLRLVNASQPAWQIRWTGSFDVNTENMQTQRNDIALLVRQGLYDNSTLRTPALAGTSKAYINYLDAYRATIQRKYRDALQLALRSKSDSNTAYNATLLSGLVEPPESAALIVEALELDPNFPAARVANVRLRFRQDKDLRRYLIDLEDLVGEFPNTEAVLHLADLYAALSWDNGAEELLVRWALLNPRSAEPALKLAELRYRTGDIAGTEEAMKIASLREPDSRHVEYWRDVYRLLQDLPVHQVERNPELYLRKLALDGDSDGALRVLAQVEPITSCDQRIELSLYVQDLDGAYDGLHCADKLWVTPPPFWSLEEARWQLFLDDPRFEPYVASISLDPESIAGLSPKAIPTLLAPRR